MNLPWTPADDAALKDAASTGISVQRLSVRLHRPVASIKGRLNFLGVKASTVPRLPYNERVSVMR